MNRKQIITNIQAFLIVVLLSALTAWIILSAW